MWSCLLRSDVGLSTTRVHIHAQSDPKKMLTILHGPVIRPAYNETGVSLSSVSRREPFGTTLGVSVLA